MKRKLGIGRLGLGNRRPSGGGGGAAIPDGTLIDDAGNEFIDDAGAYLIGDI